jgi:VanZ family protein
VFRQLGWRQGSSVTEGNNVMTRLAFGYTVALFIFLLLADFGLFRPLGEFVNTVPALDKLLHFLMYGCLAFLANVALSRRPRWSLIGAIATGSIIVIIVSTLEEYSNIFTPCRTWSLSDLAANYLGVACLGVFPLAWLPVRCGELQMCAATIDADVPVTDGE